MKRRRKSEVQRAEARATAKPEYLSGRGPRKCRHFVLGVTGSFGSGKSTVSRMLKAGGVRIVDADRIAHRLLDDEGIRRRISALIGRGIGAKGKALRLKLGEAVFRDRKMLAGLQKIMHPRIISGIKKEIRESKEKNIILDAPLLIEAGLDAMADQLLVVTAGREEQIRRLLRKTNLKKADILKRIRAQYPLSKKVRMADFIIDNNYTLKKTKEQASKIRRLLWKS